MSRTSAIVLTVILALVLAAMVVGTVFLVRGTRTIQTHLIPEGYVGWVWVYYGVDGAPPLPIEDGQRILRYGAEGKLETSSEYEEGWAMDRFYAVAGDTRRPLRRRPPGFEGEIWGVGTSSQVVTIDGGKKTRFGASTHFFVGTEAEYNAAGGN